MSRAAVTEATPLAELVNVRGRFHRSVHLPHDFHRQPPDAGEYIVTPVIEGIAAQILAELARPGGTRAWTLTGPYGAREVRFRPLSDRRAHRAAAGASGGGGTA